MVYIGIDNGVTGSIGIISEEEYSFFKTPTIKQQDYTQKKKNISRIDTKLLYELLMDLGFRKDVKAIIERPMINSMRFNSSISAARALEATLIVLEDLDISYTFIDSKSWQKELLPIGVKSSPELKAASFDIGCRLFPSTEESIIKQKDADGLLIAEWLKRFDNGTLKRKVKSY